uniref:U1 small nuclear ribonucleoprotein 70 kDa n=1 Tax=Arcella intermedia TaxID=1963864 RepID=A0A6B2LB09_9EUKA
MTRYLPPNLLFLFQAREPIEYLPPIERRKMPPYTGTAQYVKYFEDPKVAPPPPAQNVMTKEERKAKKRKERLEQEVEKIKNDLKSWDPYNNPKATDDAFKTLFVGRISFKTTEHKLKREFEVYGPIKTVRMVTDLEGKPRGYAFVEYERERDMRTAYKEGDAKKIDGKRVLVDVERGRAVNGWKPRRFGGGLGGTRIGAERDNIKFSGRAPPERTSSRNRDDRDRDRERDRERERGDRDRPRERERDRDNDRDRERGDRDRKRSRDDKDDRERNVRPRHDEPRRERRSDDPRRERREERSSNGGRDMKKK